mgnify:CR=1 FL=1
MNIAPQQHLGHALGLVVIKAQLLRALGGIDPGAEQHVPQRQTVVLRMVAMLMVHGMHFRALQHIAKPARRAHIGMGEQVEGRRQPQGHGRRSRAGTQHPVAGDHAQQHGSAGVQRMGVERGQHLDAPRAVMQLVEHAPQQVGRMGGTVPPVKDKAGDDKTAPMAANATECRDYSLEIDSLADSLNDTQKRLEDNMFINDEDRREIKLYLADFYKEIAFTRQDIEKITY